MKNNILLEGNEMDKRPDILHEAKRLRLLAAALELQHHTSTAANVVPIPGGDRVIAIGAPAAVADALQLGTKQAAAALCDADHLAEVSLRLLAAMNKLAGAREAHELHDTVETSQQQDQAQDLVSEYWRAVQDAAGEYQKRAERARRQMAQQQPGATDSEGGHHE